MSLRGKLREKPRGRGILTEKYEPMFLEDLVRSVRFESSASHAPMSAENVGSMDLSSNSDIMGMDDIIDEGFSLEDIKGWQRMACLACEIVWATPPNPVRMSMPCAKCGGMAHNDGVF